MRPSERGHTGTKAETSFKVKSFRTLRAPKVKPPTTKGLGLTGTTHGQLGKASEDTMRELEEQGI